MLLIVNIIYFILLVLPTIGIITWGCFDMYKNGCSKHPGL